MILLISSSWRLGRINLLPLPGFPTTLEPLPVSFCLSFVHWSEVIVSVTGDVINVRTTGPYTFFCFLDNFIHNIQFGSFRNPGTIYAYIESKRHTINSRPWAHMKKIMNFILSLWFNWELLQCPLLTVLGIQPTRKTTHWRIRSLLQKLFLFLVEGKDQQIKTCSRNLVTNIPDSRNGFLKSRMHVEQQV